MEGVQRRLRWAAGGVDTEEVMVHHDIRDKYCRVSCTIYHDRYIMMCMVHDTRHMMCKVEVLSCVVYHIS